MAPLPHALAAALGLLLAHHERRFRSMGRAVASLLVLDVAQIAVRMARGDVSARLKAIAAGLPVPPYEGVARASWAADQALAVTFYAVLSWAVWRALKSESPGSPQGLVAGRLSQSAAVPYLLTRGSPLRFSQVTLLALVFLASSVLLFAVYPLVRGRPVEVASVVVFCVALAVQLAAATGYILRWRRPDAAQGVALVLVVGSIADAAGPWLFAAPARDWYAGEPVGVLIWCVAIGVELWGIVMRRES